MFYFKLTSKLVSAGVEVPSDPELEVAAAAVAEGRAELVEDDPVGDPKEPNCIDKKYFVAACLSCSLSSAVCRLKSKQMLFYYVSNILY